MQNHVLLGSFAAILLIFWTNFLDLSSVMVSRFSQQINTEIIVYQYIHIFLLQLASRMKRFLLLLVTFMVRISYNFSSVLYYTFPEYALLTTLPYNSKITTYFFIFLFLRLFAIIKFSKKLNIQITHGLVELISYR